MIVLLLTLLIAFVLMAVVPYLLGIVEMLVELFQFPVFRSFLLRLTVYVGLILLVAFIAASCATDYLQRHLN